ncbi:MAG TPA: type II toxin-antitoxin system RelE/ParE family toxin [Thermoanaerobaculia bacterium]|nr:type II toxin-antitoxin system RelE/ParE family toxin [Thermoanaerobaculia bacterium]
MKPGKVLTFVNRRVNVKLVRIGWAAWEVLAIVDPRGRCQVLDFLSQLDAGYTVARRVMLLFLQVRLPQDGPPANNALLCKPLGDGLFELRRQPKGQKLRVVFFYDEGRRIVCTNAFSKAETTPRTELALAKAQRKRYLMAKLARELSIEEV